MAWRTDPAALAASLGYRSWGGAVHFFTMHFTSKACVSRLNDPDVRELAWAIGGPSLMNSLGSMDVISSRDYQRHLQASEPWLLGLDREPGLLRAHLAGKPDWKVGLRFETLVGFWLEQASSYTLLAQNLPVQKDKQTQGAFDFIVRHVSGRVEHWELAIKYYLQREASPMWNAWVGPNAKDRLDLKLDRMAQHQLPLSKTPAGKATLAALGIDKVERRAWVKGMFFRPWKAAASRPDGAACGEPRGLWLRQSELRSYAAHVDKKGGQASCWIQRKKPRWLAPAVDREGVSMQTSDWLGTVLANELPRPIMASRLAVEGGVAWEKERLFVVPDCWPKKPDIGHAKTSRSEQANASG